MKRGTGLLIAAFTLLWVCSGALASGGTSGIAYTIETASGPPKVAVASANGSSPRTVGKGSVPSLSPSGKSVAFGTVGGGGPSLVVYSPTGKLQGKYFNSKQVEVGPIAWSHDSRYLAVGLTDVNATTKIGKSGMAIVDTTTGKIYMVAHGMVSGASWDPSGDSVVFGLTTKANFSGGWNLYTSGPNTITLHKITTNNNSLNPVWGKLGIAYTQSKERGKNSAPQYQIWLMNGAHSTQITRVKANFLQEGLVPLAVSANGVDMIADFVGQDTSYAYTVNLKTHATKKLIVSGQTVTPWGVSKNGKRVLVVFGGFETAAGTIETLPFGGGSPTVLVAHGNFPSWNQ
jgi:Tol biopolymer transport system component